MPGETLTIVLRLGFDRRVPVQSAGSEIIGQFAGMMGKRLSERGLCCEMMSAGPVFT